MNILEQIVSAGADSKGCTGPVRVLGIDLGTTNSTVTEIVFDPGRTEAPEIRCLPVEQPTEGRGWWNPLVPSIVALHDGREIVGEGARRLRARGRAVGLIDRGSLFASCKNDMGLRRTYHMAPAGYRSAAEVGGRLLAFLRQAAMKDKPLPPVRTTVTVPASFQAAQRHDTLKAATLAGLTVSGGDLLDEPVAAFIGYLCDHPEEELVEPGETRHLLVFDFGGGTCDVAVFRLGRDREGGRLTIASLAVSRYHRLGGGDIDQAILYEVLLPQLLEQNGLDRRAIDFDTKKNILEPAFIGLAEELKAGLCDKLARARDGGEKMAGLAQTCPGEHVCTLADGTRLTLTNPSLSADQLDELLAPFLDPDLLCLRETEYRQTLSIFTPIRDALERCGLAQEDIDLCLLAGGSCLIPQVVEALNGFFNGQLLTFDNADAMQLAVARGAAVNALSLAVAGRPVVQPVCQETIAIVTSDGPLDLVPKGASLPWPAGGGYQYATTLALPQSSPLAPVAVRIEVVARESLGMRPLFGGQWQVPAPVTAGEQIRLAYSYDENQVLELRLSHAAREDVPDFTGNREHPLTHVVNPQAVKLRIDEAEERLRTEEFRPEERDDVMIALADDCARLRQYEKAIARLAEVLRRRGTPEGWIINRMAIYWGYLNDEEREERLYREAVAVDPRCDTAWFNLALLLQRQKRFAEASEVISRAAWIDPDSAPYYVLHAQIDDAVGEDEKKGRLLGMAMKRFRPMNEQGEWELYWFQAAAELMEDSVGVDAVRKERQRRKSGQLLTVKHGESGMLPALAFRG